MSEVGEEIATLADSIALMHQKLVDISDEKNKKARTRAMKKTKAMPNPEVGDFVLIGRVLRKPNKLALQWQGPCRVVKVRSNWLYDVQTLFEPIRTTTHHITRLKFYAEKHLNQLEDLKQQAIYNQEMFSVAALLGYRLEENMWQLQVQWSGFDIHEATWEPLDVLLQDIPKMVIQAVEQWKHNTPQHEQLSELSEYVEANTRHVNVN